jgi:hypothetical protein
MRDTESGTLHSAVIVRLLPMERRALSIAPLWYGKGLENASSRT